MLHTAYYSYSFVFHIYFDKYFNNSKHEYGNKMLFIAHKYIKIILMRTFHPFLLQFVWRPLEDNVISWNHHLCNSLGIYALLFWNYTSILSSHRWFHLTSIYYLEPFTVPRAAIIQDRTRKKLCKIFFSRDIVVHLQSVNRAKLRGSVNFE